MGRVKDTFQWCLKQGDKEKKHKGLKKIKPNSEESKNQIKKAISDLDTMQYLHKGEKTGLGCFYCFLCNVPFFAGYFV